MKTFKDIKVGDKLFSITTNGDLNAIIIEDIGESRIIKENNLSS